MFYDTCHLVRGTLGIFQVLTWPGEEHGAHHSRTYTEQVVVSHFVVGCRRGVQLPRSCFRPQSQRYLDTVRCAQNGSSSQLGGMSGQLLSPKPSLYEWAGGRECVTSDSLPQ